MSSKEEFLDSFGPPDNSVAVSADAVQRARGRLPESLIDFWLQYGIGSYASKTLHLCTPDLFDPVIDRLLVNVPQLRGHLAAFAYTALGDVLLWHDAQRNFILYLQFATFDDQTSRTETDPVPDNLDEIYRTVGIEPPADAAAVYLENRRRPANLWERLAVYASISNVDPELDDEGQPLYNAIVKMHGPLDQEEIYMRYPPPEGFRTIAASYFRSALRDAFARLLQTVKICRAIEVDGVQQIVTTEHPAGDTWQGFRLPSCAAVSPSFGDRGRGVAGHSPRRVVKHERPQHRADTDRSAALVRPPSGEGTRSPHHPRQHGAECGGPDPGHAARDIWEAA